MSFKINISENRLYYKELFKLIKQFTATPKLTVINNILTVKTIDINNHMRLDLTLQSKQNKLSNFFAGGTTTQQQINATATVDIEELLKALTPTSKQITIANDKVTIDSTPIKTYPTFKSDLPPVNMQPTYTANVNLAQFWDAIKDMEFLAHLHAVNNQITIEHNNGYDTTTIKTLQTQPISWHETKSLYSCTYLKQLTKSLLLLAENAKISFANDNPFVFETTLKYNMCSIALYLAPAIYLEVKH